MAWINLEAIATGRNPEADLWVENNFKHGALYRQIEVWGGYECMAITKIKRR